VVNARSTKFGDFRAHTSSQKCLITINRDLPEPAFCITLLHELAHYFTLKKHGRRVKPHGLEWKNEFRALLDPFLIAKVFPAAVHNALNVPAYKLKASSYGDLKLARALIKPLSDENFIRVEDLNTGDVFNFKTKGLFRVEKKLRTRFRCVHIKTNRAYTFSALAEVEKVQHFI